MMGVLPADGLARRLLRGPGRLIRRTVLPTLIPPHRGALRGAVRTVRVVGLLSQASGHGEAARLCVEDLRRSGFRVETCDVSALLATSDRAYVPGDAGGRHAAPDLTIYLLNPPMLMTAILASGLASYYRGYNVGYWAWEVETLPREWISALSYVDAILVPSTFCRRVIQRYTEKPVHIVPHPVRRAGANRNADASPPSRKFSVLSVFNFASSLRRKNPEALVAAFAQAFGEDGDCELTLKTSDGVRHPRELAELNAHIGERKNVRLVDAVWSDAELSAAYHRASVYASLHRSEGFGLTLAEAMMHEVPVVYTDWSGCRDFCRPELGFPVRYHLVPLHDTHGDYSESRDGRWAEPSVADAARQLARVRADPHGAKERARLQRRHLEHYLETRTYAGALASLSRRAGTSPTVRDEP